MSTKLKPLIWLALALIAVNLLSGVKSAAAETTAQKLANEPAAQPYPTPDEEGEAPEEEYREHTPGLLVGAVVLVLIVVGGVLWHGRKKPETKPEG